MLGALPPTRARSGLPNAVMGQVVALLMWQQPCGAGGTEEVPYGHGRRCVELAQPRHVQWDGHVTDEILQPRFPKIARWPPALGSSGVSLHALQSGAESSLR